MLSDRSWPWPDVVSAAHVTLIHLVEKLPFGDWQAALDTAARFQWHSFGNNLRIAASHARAYAKGRVLDPQPDLMAGYRTSQSLGRQVQRGQQGNAIRGPRSGTVRDTAPNGDDHSPKQTAPPDDGDAIPARRWVTGWTTAIVLRLSQTEAPNRATAERVVRTARTILDTLPTDHWLGGQPRAAGRNVEPERRPRPAPAVTPPPAGVIR